MNIYSTSGFKDENADKTYFEDWVKKLESHNGRTYERFVITTSLGRTHLWGLNTSDPEADTLVIFPGARTTSLIWDFDRGLDNLHHRLRIFMVETNGLPNLSDGATPDIKTLDYGYWAAEVFEQLNITQAFVAGASFGGLICMKLGIVHPEKIKLAFLLNPGCLQPFSLSFSNLYYNLLPIIRPTARNVRTFLDKAIFSKPNHQLSDESEQLLVDYEMFAISRYNDKTQKPYYMGAELQRVKAETIVLLGDRDLLFPYSKSVANAKKHLQNLREIKVYSQVGHGIETYREAMTHIGTTVKAYRTSQE